MTLTSLDRFTFAIGRDCADLRRRSYTEPYSPPAVDRAQCVRTTAMPHCYRIASRIGAILDVHLRAEMAFRRQTCWSRAACQSCLRLATTPPRFLAASRTSFGARSQSTSDESRRQSDEWSTLEMLGLPNRSGEQFQNARLDQPKQATVPRLRASRLQGGHLRAPRHDPPHAQAASAASTAVVASSPPKGTRAISSPVAGLSTRPAPSPIYWPPT